MNPSKNGAEHPKEATARAAAHKFGTAPVFLTAISTILGAIMFLRFGYAVGNVGFAGTLLIILIGHLVTIPTAMAIAEIATNQRVEGGGEYFILSRSFGLTIGASIGVALYLSQAISVAFYMIAFSQAFDPVFAFLRDNYGILLSDKRIVAVPGTILLSLLIVAKGADLGIKALYGVVAILFVAIGAFLLGTPMEGSAEGFSRFVRTIENPASFFLVFAICFPAFTGMTAGVGLSGELKDPRRSIPIGTLAATLTGMAVYVVIAWKLAASAPPEVLDKDQLVMSRIALCGPIIPIGLAAATLSSALGSFLVAPRTLQALAQDGVFPLPRLTGWLARTKGARCEPVNASLVTGAIAVAFAAMGDVDFVAQVISMFFMVTYGSICLVSFLEHFAADPAYRPTFRSRWFISFAGAVLCVWLMFKMSAAYAALSVAVMVGLYLVISRQYPEKRGLSGIAQGVIFQLSRQLQVFLQKSHKQEQAGWRPAVVCLSSASFERLEAFDLLRWLSARYGFGTYIHYIHGYLSSSTYRESKAVQERLIHLANASRSNVYVDTMVCPSYTTAISQLVQIPGISGKENNMVLLEYDRARPDDLDAILDNFHLVSASGFDVCILSSSPRGFGYHREIHVWITPADYENAELMILLAYILMGHRDWRKGLIRIFSILPEEEAQAGEQRLRKLIRAGRLPISEHNLEFRTQTPDVAKTDMIEKDSRDADLIIAGYRGEAVRHLRGKLFDGYEGVGNVLFVNTSNEHKLITDETAEPLPPDGEEETPTPPAP